MLLTPGPVELTDEISRAQTRPMMYQRSPEYREVHSRTCDKARVFLDSDEAFLITGSGTAGLEAGIASLVRESDSVFVAHNGKFGERVADIARVFCPNVSASGFEYGKGISLERVKQGIDDSHPSVVALVHNETSTGVCNRAREIVKYAKGKGALAIVDGISAVGGHEFSLREWGADFIVAGSQKALGAPPGLALVGLGKEAIERIKGNSPKAYYLSLKRYLDAGKGNPPYTPAVTLVYALEAALDIAFKEGIPQRVERHRKAGEFTRKRLVGLGLGLFAENGFESNTVTSFSVSSPEQADRIRNGLAKEYGITIAGGQGSMKGKILRVGHMGNFRQQDLEKCLGAIEKLK